MKEIYKSKDKIFVFDVYQQEKGVLYYPTDKAIYIYLTKLNTLRKNVGGTFDKKNCKIIGGKIIDSMTIPNDMQITKFYELLTK